jgi:hypothetical protein
MSPAWIPARSAGESGATSRTRTSPVDAVVPVANAMVRTKSARTMFIVTPAARTIACAHQGFDVNDPGWPSPACRIAKSSWPRMRTKPPNGMALML